MSFGNPSSFAFVNSTRFRAGTIPPPRYPIPSPSMKPVAFFRRRDLRAETNCKPPPMRRTPDSPSGTTTRRQVGLALHEKHEPSSTRHRPSPKAEQAVSCWGSGPQSRPLAEGDNLHRTESRPDSPHHARGSTGMPNGWTCPSASAAAFARRQIRPQKQRQHRAGKGRIGPIVDIPATLFANVPRAGIACGSVPRLCTGHA